MNALQVPRDPLERPFQVFRYSGGVQRLLGIVMARDHTLADKRAVNLYGSGVWTKEKP